MPTLTGRDAQFFIMDELAGEPQTLDVVDATIMGSRTRRDVITNNTETNVASALTSEMLLDAWRSIEGATYLGRPVRHEDFRRLYQGDFRIQPLDPVSREPRYERIADWIPLPDRHIGEIMVDPFHVRNYRKTIRVSTTDGHRFCIDSETGRVDDSTVNSHDGKYRGATADIAEHMAFWRQFDPDYSIDNLDVRTLHFKFADGTEQPPCSVERNDLIDEFLEDRPDHPQGIVRGLPGRIEPDWTRFEYLELLGCNIEAGKTEVTTGLDRGDSAYFTVYGKLKDGGNEPLLEIKEHPEVHDDAYLVACIKASQVAKMSFLPLYILV